MSSIGYSTFGPANPLTKENVDPTSQCVGNTFFTKSGITGSRMQKDFCPRFMAQRCSTQWDEYCEAYLISSNSDMAGNTFVNKEFLNETAKKKYCRLDVDKAGSHCSLKCESFLPSGQTSVDICENVGTFNYLDTKSEYDLTGDFPQSGRLKQVSPLYYTSCPDICDAKDTTINPDVLTEKDNVLNKCIEHGACTTTLLDLAYNLVKNSQTDKVTNKAFQKIIQNAKIDAPVNPNIVVKLGQDFGISPEIALDVLQDAKYGYNEKNSPYKFPQTTKNNNTDYEPYSVSANFAPNLSAIADKMNQKAGFNPFAPDSSSNKTSIVVNPFAPDSSSNKTSIVVNPFAPDNKTVENYRSKSNPVHSRTKNMSSSGSNEKDDKCSNNLLIIVFLLLIILAIYSCVKIFKN